MIADAVRSLFIHLSGTPNAVPCALMWNDPTTPETDMHKLDTCNISIDMASPARYSHDTRRYSCIVSLDVLSAADTTALAILENLETKLLVGKAPRYTFPVGSTTGVVVEGHVIEWDIRDALDFMYLTYNNYAHWRTMFSISFRKIQ